MVRINLVPNKGTICPELAVVPTGYRCVVCGEKKGAATMLLCDQCQRGWHMTCLTPPLSMLPKGEWICPRCKRASGHAQSSDRRRWSLWVNVVVFATTTSLFKGVRGQIHAIETGMWDQVESNHKRWKRLRMGLNSTQLTTLIWFLLRRSTWTSANQKLPFDNCGMSVMHFWL